MTTNDDFEFEDPDYKSKTQLKIEMHELRDLGLQIAELPLNILDTLEISPTLRDAIDDYRRIGHKNALKRQASFIGKLMRKENVDAVKAQLSEIQEDRHRATRQLHVVEHWRDRLLSDPSALEEFLHAAPLADRQQLRSVLRVAAKEQSQGKPPAAARKLFKLVQLWLNQKQDY